MADSQQRVPIEGATRLRLDARDADVLTRWVEDLDELIVIGREVPVDQAADEIFIWADASAQPGADDQVRISGLGLPGGIGPEEILIRTGLFSGWSKGRKGPPIQILVPYQLSSTTLELKEGDLQLENPRGNVECRLKRGDFASSGGHAELNVATGSGDVWIAELTGSIRSAGGSGNVTIQDSQAITNIAAGSGGISLLRVSGDAIKVAAGSGGITLQGARAESLSIEAGSGDISIRDGHLERISVRTGSGDVECSAIFGPHAQSFTTGSGSILLGIPSELPARIEAFTSSGDIDSDPPLVSVGQRGPRSRTARRQVGSVGTGEPRAEVSVRTSSGDIRLYWLQQAAASHRTHHPRETVPESPGPSGEAPEPAADETVPSGATSPETARETDAGQADAQRDVLESLARGEITADEAEQLLQTLESRARHSR